MMQQQITPDLSGWWIVSDGDNIWLPENKLPFGTALQWGLGGSQGWMIGEWQGSPIWLVIQESFAQMVSLRALLDVDATLFQLAGRGVQLAAFMKTHRFCGHCGHPMTPVTSEWAMQCPQCRQRYYPQIAPCIIVSIRRDDHILLAQHRQHRRGVYTVLAGFVEVGETLEQAVVREVREESQIEICHLRYITSQPWPFPHSLMMAFMADYAAGEICFCPDELISADWYHYNKLPPLPSPGTVARRLIEDTRILCRESES